MGLKSSPLFVSALCNAWIGKFPLSLERLKASELIHFSCPDLDSELLRIIRPYGPYCINTSPPS